MSDLKEVIARVRKDMQHVRVEPDGTLDMWFAATDLTRLLDAAEAAEKARDAALEEAATAVESFADDSVMAEDELREAAEYIRALRGAA